MSTSTSSAPGRSTAVPRLGGGPLSTGWPLFGPWPEHWPLTVLLLGYPLWWALGVSAFMPFVVAVPMAMQLLRRHPVRMPFGFSWWLVFVLWVAAGVAVLFVDAPAAVPGGGASRLIVFTYRLVWYLVLSIVVLWVLNLDEEELPTRHVVRLLGFMFVVTAVGGLAGVLLPAFEFTSPLELVLPGAIRSNDFVNSLVHPATSYIQSVLGFESPRPIAPFSFANAWGANLSMFLPFFLIGWMGRDAGWRRAAAPVVLVLASVPVVLSLNRGLWASIAVGAIFLVLRLVFTGRMLGVVGAVLCLAIAVAALVASPLGDLASARLDNPHSNDRRGELLSLTVSSAAEGSPVMGFGSTRDVQGSFASIAGGSTPDCPGCGVPPLGTQGYLWMVIFSQGFIGAVAFLGFFGTQLVRNWRSRTTVQAAGVCVLLFFFVQMFIYDNIGMPTYTVMIAIGLMERERRRGARGTGPTLAAVIGPVRRHGRMFLACTVAGALIGAAIGLTRPATYSATVSVLLSPAPVYLDPGSDDEPRQITVDTEAGMVFSERAVSQVVEGLDLSDGQDLRDRIRVTAPENTRVLDITVHDEDPASAVATAELLSSAYLSVRGEYLEQRREQLRRQLERQLAVVAGTGATIDGNTGGGPVLIEDELIEQLKDVDLYATTPGEVLRPPVATRVRSQVEVPIVSGALLGLLAGASASSLAEAQQRRRATARVLATPVARTRAPT